MTPLKLLKTAFVLTAAGFVFHAEGAPGDTWRNAQGEEVRQLTAKNQYDRKYLRRCEVDFQGTQGGHRKKRRGELPRVHRFIPVFHF